MREAPAIVFFCHSRGSNRESSVFKKRRDLDSRLRGNDSEYQEFRTFEKDPRDGRLKSFDFCNLQSAICNSRRAGFTLLEVLLAVAIFSVIVAALYSTFFLSHRAVEAVDDSLLRLQESRAVIDTVKRELESALYRDNDKEHTVFKLADRDFYGREASQIVFTCFSPLVNGLAKVSYEIEERDGTLSLNKKIASAFSRSAETKPLDLIEDVESFTIEAKHGDKWVKTWDSALANGRIPDEIRISLRIRPKRQSGGEEKSSSGVLTVSDVARPKIERIL